MSSKFKVQSSKFRRRIVGSEISATILLILLTLSCSVPNLEKPECTTAREPIKEFYSVHFGNEMQPSAEYLKKRERFLTADWKSFVAKNLQSKYDYFTLTEEYPKAFRIGECQANAPDKTVFQVVFFWKDDARSEQREARIEMIKENDKWLINRTF